MPNRLLLRRAGKKERSRFSALNASRPSFYLVLPALLDRLADTLVVLATVVLVQVRGFDIGGRGSVGVVKETLDTGQDGSHIVRGAPPILQDVQAEFTRAVDVWVEHLADELDARRLVRVCFFEVHDQFEGSIFEGRISRTNDDCIPGHHIVGNRGGRDTSGGIGLHTLEVAHQSTTCGGRHGEKGTVFGVLIGNVDADEASRGTIVS